MEAIWLRFQSAMNVHELQNCKRMTVGTTSETGIDKTCSRDCHSRILRSQLRYDLGLQPQEPLDKLLGIQMTKNDLIPHWFLTFLHFVHLSSCIFLSSSLWFSHWFSSWRPMTQPGESSAPQVVEATTPGEAMLSRCCAHMWPPCHQPVNPSTVPHPWHQPVGARLSTLSPNRSPGTT